MTEKRLNRLGEILAAKGVKSVWVADRLNLTKATVSHYVTNKHQPSLEVLYQLATLLNLKVSDLLYDDLKIQPKEEPRKHKMSKNDKSVKPDDK